jgi:ZIP family zinc transporter
LETSTVAAVVLLATLSGFTTIIGVLIAVHVSRSEKWIAGGIGFSVGIMILISLLELIPSSLRSADAMEVAIAAILGAGLIGLLHYLLPHTHLFKEQGIFKSNAIKASYLVAIGLILHDFPEGFAMANAYIAAPSLGVTVAIAIALHNIPEEFSIAVPAAISRDRAVLLKAAVVSAFAEPLGAVLGLALGGARPNLVPLFMAFAAGAMVFVSLHELLPMARKYGRFFYFAMGIICSAGVYGLLEMILKVKV